jgi:hypothetical protein
MQGARNALITVSFLQASRRMIRSRRIPPAPHASFAPRFRQMKLQSSIDALFALVFAICVLLALLLLAG